MLERNVFEDLVSAGQAILDRQNNARLDHILLSNTIQGESVLHANPAFCCEMYGCPPTCRYADGKRTPEEPGTETGASGPLPDGPGNPERPAKRPAARPEMRP